MNHEELKRDLTARLDRLEDELKTQLGGIESRLDDLIPDVIQSTTKNATRIDGMQGQIRLIWTVLLAAIGSAATYILNKLS